MARLTLDDAVAEALNLLPPAGTEVEFDAYKTQLYAANPDNGRDAFAHILKRDLVKKNMVTVADHTHKVMLSRLS